MRLARFLVLLLAISSAVGAAILVKRTAQVPIARPATSMPAKTQILTLGRNIPNGENIQMTDLVWQDWASDTVPDGAYIRRQGKIQRIFTPAMARYPLIKGDVLLEKKLLRPGDGSAIAALISQGKRAIAVPVRDESAAGGLLQPNDRVDVIWTPRLRDQNAGKLRSRLLLRRIKILAIGQSLRARSGNQRGRTATLELTPGQAQLIVSAQQNGDLSLALIPATETASLGENNEPLPWQEAPSQNIKIIKFGR